MRETEIQQFEREIKGLKLKDQNAKLRQKLEEKERELQEERNKLADLEDICIDYLSGSQSAYESLKKKFKKVLDIEDNRLLQYG